MISAGWLVIILAELFLAGQAFFSWHDTRRRARDRWYAGLLELYSTAPHVQLDGNDTVTEKHPR